MGLNYFDEALLGKRGGFRGEGGGESERRGFRATPSGVLRWVLFYNFIGRDRVSAF